MANQEKINKFLKRFYEDMIIECICCDDTFMYEEMKNPEYVYALYVTIVHHPFGVEYLLYTEDNIPEKQSPASLDIEGDRLIELAAFLDEMGVTYSPFDSGFEENNIVLLRADFDVRSWYESYMVPLMKAAMQVREL